MSKTTKTNKYLKSMILSIVLIGITFYFLFRGSEISELITAIKSVNSFYLIAGLALMFMFIIFEALSIKILLKSFNYRVPFLKCIKYAFIGFYFSSITPTSFGQPAQVYYMKKDGIEIGESSLSILIITISYQVAIILLGIIMFSVRTKLITENFGIMKFLVIFGLIMNFSIIVIFIFTALQNNFLKRVINGSIRFLSKLKIVKNPEETLNKSDIQINQYKKGAEYLKINPSILLWVLLERTMQILSRLSVTFAVYKAFGLSGHGLIDIIALQTILALAVESVPIPGSIGAFEAGFLRANKVIFGEDKLLPAMLLSRGISYYVMLLISGGVVLLAHFFASKHPVQNDAVQK